MKNRGRNRRGKTGARAGEKKAAGGRNAVFVRAQIVAPKASVDELAGQFVKRINFEAVVHEIGTRLGPGAVEDILYRAFCDEISASGIHKTWIAEIDRISRNAENITEIRNALSAYLRQAGIIRIDDVAIDETRFVVSGGIGNAIIADQPAYIDSASNRTILSGRARRTSLADEPADGKQEER
jgi:hypothetical protein